jgi:hypothetical protein
VTSSIWKRLRCISRAPSGQIHALPLLPLKSFGVSHPRTALVPVSSAYPNTYWVQLRAFFFEVTAPVRSCCTSTRLWPGLRLRCGLQAMSVLVLRDGGDSLLCVCGSVARMGDHGGRRWRLVMQLAFVYRDGYGWSGIAIALIMVAPIPNLPCPNTGSCTCSGFVCWFCLVFFGFPLRQRISPGERPAQLTHWPSHPGPTFTNNFRNTRFPAQDLSRCAALFLGW